MQPPMHAGRHGTLGSAHTGCRESNGDNAFAIIG